MNLAAPPKTSTLVGIALAIAATACFACLDTTTRFVTIAGVPMIMALWVRYGIQALSTTALTRRRWAEGIWRTAHPKYHLVRGLLLMGSSLFVFLGLKHMPVGEFTAIAMITPLVVTVIAAYFFKEPISPLRWLLLVAGFVGTMMIIRPGGESFNWGLLFPLGSVATNTGFQLLTSRLARTEDPMTMQLYSGWIGFTITAVLLPFAWSPEVAWHDALALVIMGTAATLGHWLFILAFARAPATVLSPYFYGQIGFAMLGGWLIFAHVPDLWSLRGMALIALSGCVGAWLTRHEERHKVVDVLQEDFHPET